MTIVFMVLTAVWFVVAIVALGYAWWYRTLYRALAEAVAKQIHKVDLQLGGLDGRAIAKAVDPIAWIHPASGVRH